jgi:nitrogen regulatory protein PII
MKMLIASIRPSRLEEVRHELRETGITDITVLEVEGFGKTEGHIESYRGQTFSVNRQPRIQIEIALNDDFVQKASEAICKGGRTGEVGDGKIFVIEMPDVIEIRTGKNGQEVL